MLFLRGRYHGRSAAHILRLRLQHWFEQEINDEHMQTVVYNLHMIGKRMPPLLFIAAIRTICNSWNTARRFQQTSKCRLCSATAGDDIRHYLDCPAVHAHVLDKLPHLQLPWCGANDPMKGFLLIERTSLQQIFGVAIIQDAIQMSINALRHS
eukprot:4848936-Karenia_brevis.AAC.1